MSEKNLITYENLVAVYDIMGFREHCKNLGDDIAMENLLNCFDKIDDYYNEMTEVYQQNVLDGFVKGIVNSTEEYEAPHVDELIDKLAELVVIKFIRCELQADNIIIWIDEEDEYYKELRKRLAKLYNLHNNETMTKDEIEKYFNSIILINFLWYNLSVNLTFLCETGWFLRGAINYGKIILNEYPHLIAGEAFLDAHTLGEKQDSFTTIIMPKAIAKFTEYSYIDMLLKVYFPLLPIKFKKSSVPVLCNTMNIFQAFFELPNNGNDRIAMFDKILEVAKTKLILSDDVKNYMHSQSIFYEFKSLSKLEEKWMNTLNIIVLCAGFTTYHFHMTTFEKAGSENSN